VLLLHLVAQAEPRPKVVAVHIDHGLRGDEGFEDAAFCARLCGRLQVPFVRRALELDGDAPNLEARAREGRYALLAEEASRSAVRVVLTGHHQDDALETLLMRWMRGSALPGLAGLKARTTFGKGDRRIDVARPLLALRREEVRRLLRDHEIEWREDSSNKSPRFTRNRVRHGLLPQVEEVCGDQGLSNLRSFASAVEGLEEELAGRTAHLSWSPPLHAPALRSQRDAHVGGCLDRRSLSELAAPLQRRALWRLVSEGTGRAPSRALLELLQDDLAGGRLTCRSLPGGWSLHLRKSRLHLAPGLPRRAVVGPAPDQGQLQLPFHDLPPGPRREPRGRRLGLPGSVPLSDGRVISAEIVLVPSTRDVPHSEVEVELDAEGLTGELCVRTLQAGDRFHALGAPGSRPLTRFLADAGVPREERPRVPLVFAGDELVWVAGIRPCESRRVDARTTRRLRLRLEGAARPAPGRTQEAGPLF